AVGRARDGPEALLVAGYLGLLPWPAHVVEVREAAARPDRRRLEGEALLAAVPAGATVVALDPKGQALSSEAFARRVARWRDGGVRNLAFVIGGADGLAPAVLARADARLSLGPMTWPHLLARVLLAEQLWRAASLLAGHPYHRR
ncbi:MAG: 23S rRNA (pseudouridine(1915)-N(3))-methyltransferase RlmH, partial [Alphaproteobacteria bacterium]